MIFILQTKEVSKYEKALFIFLLNKNKNIFLKKPLI